MAVGTVLAWTWMTWIAESPGTRLITCGVIAGVVVGQFHYERLLLRYRRLRRST